MMTKLDIGSGTRLIRQPLSAPTRLQQQNNNDDDNNDDDNNDNDDNDDNEWMTVVKMLFL